MTAPSFSSAVFIGRFQPFHLGHAALLREALAIAPRCVVVIGSAYQARTPKNPFTWQERAEMIQLGLPEADRERVLFLPTRDYYDEERWSAAVRRGMLELVPAAAPIALVGHFKDATSEYLRGFPGWSLVSVERSAAADATSLRDAYFGCADGNVDAALAALVNLAPQTTIDFLRAWAALPFFPSIAEEWRLLRADKQAWAVAPYPPIFVTVDAVVRCAGHVLLVRRGRAPGKGQWAVPGGFVEQRETVYQSAVRELKEETGLALLDVSMRQCLKSVAVFDHPDRSLRGRTITHAHFFDLGDRPLPEVRAGDDAADAQWMPIDKLASIEDCFLDDHFHMLDHFLALTSPGRSG
jgi:bifunctional NMN adenylyltransferase/nudix hydrolase